MGAYIRPAIFSLILLTAITGMAYPVVVTILAWTVFPRQAGGSLLVEEDQPIGSALIGQPFTDPRYFWSRPSATSPPCNGDASSGSNQAPGNPDLVKAVAERIAALKAADPGNDKAVPIDLVTASGSGLDPHISPAAAEYQVARVARERKMTEAAVRKLVARCTEGRQFGILGEPGVNVLELNCALDHRDEHLLAPSHPQLYRWRGFFPDAR